MKKISIICLCLLLSSCTAMKVSREEASCNPTYKTRSVNLVNQEVAIIKVVGDDSSNKNLAKSVVLSYAQSDKTLYAELRCLVAAESRLNPKDDMLMVTVVFENVPSVEHFMLNRKENIFISASFAPISSQGDGILLGTAQVIFPLEQVITNLSNPGSIGRVVVLGNMRQLFDVQTVQDMVNKLSNGQVSQSQ